MHIDGESLKDINKRHLQKYRVVYRTDKKEHFQFSCIEKMALPAALSFQIDANTNEITVIPPNTSALDQWLTSDLEQLCAGKGSQLTSGWSHPTVTTDGVMYCMADTAVSKVRVIHAWIPVQVSVDIVRQFLSKPNNAQIYSPQLSTLQVMKTWQEEPRRSIVAAQVSFPTPLISDRQLLWYSTERTTEQGHYVRAARSCRWSQADKILKGGVRGVLHCSGFVVQPIASSPGTCMLHYLCQADPCGWIPSGIVNQVQMDQLQVPLRIKKHLNA